MKVFVPLRWAVSRLDIHLFLVILASLAVFYQIESLIANVWTSTGYALIPGLMWMLGAKFIAKRRDERAPAEATE